MAALAECSLAQPGKQGCGLLEVEPTVLSNGHCSYIELSAGLSIPQELSILMLYCLPNNLYR